MIVPVDPRFQRLHEIVTTAADIQAAMAVLSWDQQTYMPGAGAAARAEQRATLARLAHQMLTSDEVGELLDALTAEYDLTSTDDLPSYLRVLRRRYEQARKLPDRLVAEFTQATAMAHGAWVQAKEANDFAIFRPAMERILALSIERAERLGYQDRRYDALLDQYEPDTKRADIEPVFAELKAALVPMIQDIARKPPVDDSFLYQQFDLDKQWQFGLEMLSAIGFDLSRGRQDVSPHPFTTYFSRQDVRLTTWRKPAELAPPLFSTLHEGGHGIHGQNRPDAYERTPLAHSPGQSISESQSRLFENVVGRSLAFWQRHYHRLQELFSAQLGNVSLEAFYRAINKVEPSFIRVDADELTYHMHIMLRFELEQEMMAGTIAVADLPEAWNERMRSYLGVVPPTYSQGVLQDIHWSHGMIGYFPTYSLGSLLAVQLYDSAVAERPEIVAELEQGTCDALRQWLVERLYSWGNKLTPPALVRKVTGQPIQAAPFIKYAREKFGAIYN